MRTFSEDQPVQYNKRGPKPRTPGEDELFEYDTVEDVEYVQTFARNVVDFDIE